MPLIYAALFGLNAWVFIDNAESERSYRKLFMAAAAACMALDFAALLR